MRQVLISSLMLLSLFNGGAQAQHEPWNTTVYPQDKTNWWWSDDWFDKGKLPSPANLDVKVEAASIEQNDKSIPYRVYRPADNKKYPGVLFMHGRRGIDDMTARHPYRLAAQGFVVLAPDIYSANFIEERPIAHDYSIEPDVVAAIDTLRQRTDISHDKVCTVSHTRGGYYTLKALVTFEQQASAVACYVAYYPHWQDPNASEAMQVYRYANEVNALDVPILVFIGDHEQYNRVRPIMFGMEALQKQGKDARLIVYPGVGRGFDFRPPHVRTFADDLASKDAMLRTAAFIRKHLSAND